MREPVILELDAETYLLWESKQRDRHELHHGFIVAFAGNTLDRNRIGRNLAGAFEALFPLPCRRHRRLRGDAGHGERHRGDSF